MASPEEDMATGEELKAGSLPVGGGNRSTPTTSSHGIFPRIPRIGNKLLSLEKINFYFLKDQNLLFDYKLPGAN